MVLLDRSFSKAGDSTFKYIYGKFLNNINYLNHQDNFKQFQNYLSTNINDYLKSFLKLNTKFENNLNYYFFFI